MKTFNIYSPRHLRTFGENLSRRRVQHELTRLNAIFQGNDFIIIKCNIDGNACQFQLLSNVDSGCL